MIKLLTLILGNALALLVASYYIKGFGLTGTYTEIIFAILVFSAINFFLKPILKFILSPFILITLGLLTILINMGMLWVTDLILPQLQINTISTLFFATLLIGVVNFAVHLVFKK